MEKVTKTVKKATKPVAKKVVVKNANNLEIKSIATDVKNVASELVAEIKETSNEVVAMVEKMDFTENVEKITNSAKALNTQLKVTATEIADEVKDITVEVSKVANKTVKQIAKKVDVKGNVAKAKKAITKINTQMTENVEEFKNTSTKLANEMVENLNVTDRMNSVKGAIKNVNKMALETSNDMIDGMEANVAQWQNVAEKAIKTGLKLVDNQSNMMFATIEAVKVQATKTTTRFKKLFA
jgi:hypothetical protein